MPFPPSKECRILVIDDNSPFVLPLLRSFSGYNHIQLDVLVFSHTKPQLFKYSKFLGGLYLVNDPDKSNFLDHVLKKVIQLQPDLVFPTREWISGLLFEHQDVIGKQTKVHPIPDAATLSTTGDKWNLNQWLLANGFPYAKVSMTTSEWEGEYPVLLKPVFGIGGKGIKVFESREDLEKAIGTNKMFEKGFFLQEFLEGFDIDISFFAIYGEILYHTIQRGFISAKMEYSRGIVFINEQSFYELAASIVKKLNYTGIAHLDFRYSNQKEQYVLIDFNARYWSSVQGSRAMGINFPLLVVNYMMENHLEKLEYRTGHYYFATTALKVKFKNLFSKTKYPVRIKDTQLLFLYKDPLPELMYLVNRFRDLFKMQSSGS